MLKFDRDWWRGAFVPTTVLVLWVANDQLKLVNPLFLPSLASFVGSLVRLVGDDAYWVDIIKTLARVLCALAIAISAGVPVGIAFGRNLSLYKIFEGSIDFLRSLPTTAMFFLFILAFGLGDTSKIALAVFGSLFNVIVATAYGSRETPLMKQRTEMLRSFGARELDVLAMVVVWEAAPNILASIRIAASGALVIVVVAEMFLGGGDGLGRRIYESYLSYDIPSMYVSIVALGLLGYAFNRTIAAVERAFVFQNARRFSP